ncbi:MAG: sigma-70 family RNA polymerase sigma factor [Planctomycetota bacterium]
MTADEWSRESAWVARLARSLVRDPHTADDVAQDAWLSAMRTETDARGVRAWMASIVRNAARMRARGERRRQRHEDAARRLHQETVADPTAVAAQRLDLQTKLLAAVRALDEAQRTVIVLRYLEGRTPRAIAADLGVPVRTVHTRLNRALARLRAHLDREHGDERRAWLLPLTSFAHPPRAFLLSSLLMKGKLTVAVGILLLATLSLKVALDERAPAGEASRGASAHAAALPATGEQAASNPAPSQRQEVDVAPEPATPAGDRQADTAIAGIVVDDQGAPLPNVALQFLSMFDERPLLAASLHTDGSGRFASRGQTPLVVRIVDPNWVGVLEPNLFTADDQPELTVVAVPALHIEGVVVDLRGGRIPNALVSLDPERDLRALPGRQLDRCVDANRSTRTDAEGRFVFDRAPRFDPGRLNALAEGFRQYGGPAPTASTRSLQVVLEPNGELLEGRVVDNDDAPVEDALVTLGGTWARTRPDGTFRLGLAAAGLDGAVAELRALQAGRQSGRARSHSGQDSRTRAAWPSPLVLRTGEPPLSIAGRVVRFDGRPAAQVQVSLQAGYQPIPDTIEFEESGLCMGLASGSADTNLGEFEVRGLDPGTYRLRVLDPATHLVMVSEPIAAGSKDVELRLPDTGTWPALAGVVVDRQGRPVAGADWSFDGPAPDGYGEARVSGPFGHADEQGRIERAALSRAIDTLLVKGPGMADWERVLLSSLEDVGRFRVVVPVGCQAQVVLADGAGADSVAFVDSKGRDVPVVVTHGNAAWGQREVAFTSGSTQTFMAPDDLVELVLKRNGIEVRRVAVTLVLGKLNVLRL